MTKTIIVDLDGTLADVGHRLHFVQTRPKRWKEFFERMHLDRLNIWCRELVIAMRNAGFRTDIVTGRPDEYEEIIRAWLQENSIPFDRLHMRRSGDHREDSIIKKEILDAEFEKHDILFAVDDRPSVVDMWRREGLVCLQCNPH